MARYPGGDILLSEAVEATGLSDFGPGDFREGLDVLLDSLERDGDLSPSTDDEVIGAFRRRLINRLQVEAWYRDHPEVEQLGVRGPVDINGLPRTGHDRTGEHALARAPVPATAGLGADPAVPATNPGERGDGSPPVGGAGCRPAHAPGNEGDAPL